MENKMFVSKNDRSKWPARLEFDRSSQRSGRTLSVDRPLFSAQWSEWGKNPYCKRAVISTTTMIEIHHRYCISWISVAFFAFFFFLHAKRPSTIRLKSYQCHIVFISQYSRFKVLSLKIVFFLLANREGWPLKASLIPQNSQLPSISCQKTDGAERA